MISRHPRGIGGATHPAMRVLPSVLVVLGAFSFSIGGRAESLTAEEQELHSLINAARAEAGVAPLEVDAALSAVARAHSLDMATSGFFAHVSPSTGDLSDRLAAGQIGFLSAAENIALNVSVQAAHQALLDSPAHRENLLSPDLTVVGVGIVSNGRQLVVTENFVRPAAGFQATRPSDPPDAVVEEPSENELVRVEPGAGPDPGAIEDDHDCLRGPVTIIPGPQTVVPVLPAPRSFPVFQVRPMPVPRVEPVAPRGIWIVGPDGAWYPIRPLPSQRIQRRMVHRGYRYTY